MCPLLASSNSRVPPSTSVLVAAASHGKQRVPTRNAGQHSPRRRQRRCRWGTSPERAERHMSCEYRAGDRVSPANAPCIRACSTEHPAPAEVQSTPPTRHVHHRQSRREEKPSGASPPLGRAGRPQLPRSRRLFAVELRHPWLQWLRLSCRTGSWNHAVGELCSWARGSSRSSRSSRRTQDASSAGGGLAAGLRRLRRPVRG
jgi:hypothetical protein